MKCLSLFTSIICLFLACLASCTSDQRSERNLAYTAWLQNNGKLKVMSTTAMINDLVKQVGGEHVDTMTLIQGQLDPHSYQLVKGDDEKLSFAQIIFYNGVGLEHGPSLQHYLAQNPKAVAVGDYVFKQEPNAIILVNGQKDPHVWMDLSLWAKTVPLIIQILSEKDPAHAHLYQENGKRLEQQLLEAHEELKAFMHELPQEKRFLVTSHDAFNYFTRAYLAEPEEVATRKWEKRFVAPEGLAPDSQLSATDIRTIIQHMKQYNIQVLFPESNVSRDSIRKILQAGREQGLQLVIACCPLYVDAMGPAGSNADTYLKMMKHNAKEIRAYLDGQGYDN